MGLVNGAIGGGYGRGLGAYVLEAHSAVPPIIVGEREVWFSVSAGLGLVRDILWN